MTVSVSEDLFGVIFFPPHWSRRSSNVANKKNKKHWRSWKYEQMSFLKVRVIGLEDD